MYGLEAINHYNGWAMAFAGTLIVMTGLTVLSFIISQLHKVVDRPAREDAQKAPSTGSDDGEPDVGSATLWPLNLTRCAEHLKPLSASLGSEFQLMDFIAVCIENDIPHPHLTIKCLRDAGILKPQGGGVFSWN